MMPSKIKKLYNKAKKGLKNIISRKKHKTTTQGQEAKISKNETKPISPSVEQPLKLMAKPNLCSRAENVKKDKKRFKWAKEKIKSLKTKKAKPVQKDLKKSNVFKKGFKKLKGKVKKLNPIKVKKNKIIGSKKLALLLTASTIVAILPTFSLAPLPTLAITSACVFSINFIAVKTLKKFIKQRTAKSKEAEAKEVAEPEKLEDVSVESVNKENSKQIPKE